jgi:hypothetical protein
MKRLALAVPLVALAGAAAAHASVWIANAPRTVALKVDVHGAAEVDWSDGSGRHTILVPPTGRLQPGGRISGADVSRPASLHLPYQRAARRTADGTQWVLQAWAPKPGGPIELHLARWRGAATTVTASVEDNRLVGTVRFGGAPVSGTSKTPEGKPMRVVAYVDGYRATRWDRLTGVAPKANGTIALFLRPSWQAAKYRVTVAGPNRGTQLAPDAQANVFP